MASLDNQELVGVLLSMTEQQQKQLGEAITSLETIREDLHKDAVEIVKNRLDSIFNDSLSSYVSSTKKTLESSLNAFQDGILKNVEQSAQKKEENKKLEQEIKRKNEQLNHIKLVTKGLFLACILIAFGLVSYLYFWYFPDKRELEMFHVFKEQVTQATVDCKKNTTCRTFRLVRSNDGFKLETVE